MSPLLKKNDLVDKTNYRPVSRILPVTSTVYDFFLSPQFSCFENIFDKYMCAFSKGHGCQTV